MEPLYAPSPSLAASDPLGPPERFSGQTAAAAASSGCSYGEARGLFEHIEIANEIFLRSGPEQPWADALLTCQYRFFWQQGHPVLGGPVTFSEEDVFLGGVVFMMPYKRLEMERAEAIAILETIEVRTWIAEVVDGVVGELVEQPLMLSAFKDSMTEARGLTVGRQWGFIQQLPAGEYLTVTEVSRPVFFEDAFLWKVAVVITSADEG